MSPSNRSLLHRRPSLRRGVFASALVAVLFVAAAWRASGDGAARPASKPDYSGGVTCYVRVADLDRSIAWYRDVLGLEMLSRVDEVGWCELKSPVENLTIGLLRAAPPEKQEKQEKPADGAAPANPAKLANHGGATIVFGVKDVNAARTTLEAAGVRFSGPTMVHEGYVKLAAFLDPDGNLFTLSQSLVAKER